MEKFKDFLIEKNKLMQKYDAGEINIMSYKIPEKRGKDFEYDNTQEILRALNIQYDPMNIIKKFKKELKDIKYADLKNRDKAWIAREMMGLQYRPLEKTVAEFLDGDNWTLGINVFNDRGQAAQDAREYYNNNPKEKEKLFKKLKKLNSYGKYMSNFLDRQRQKAEAKLGIKWNDIVEGFKYINYFRSGSKRTIPKSLWPFLHAVTVTGVDKKRLPKTVYRGLFMDGTKVDPKQDYSEGSKIKLKNRKATSWSTSIGMAIEFSDAQDFIKDEYNGYQLVIKYDIQSPDDIIADFRVFKNMDFWNQQEILLSTDVKVGEIVFSKKKEDGNIAKEHEDLTKMGDTGYSYSIEAYLQNINKIRNFNIDLNSKIEMKEILTMNLGDVLKKYPRLLNNTDFGCLKKVNAYLGIPCSGMSSVAKSCTYNGFSLKDASTYVGGENRKILEAAGFDCGSFFSSSINILFTGRYEVVPKGYASTVIVHIKKIEIVPERDENYEQNSRALVDFEDKLYSLSDDKLKAFCPGPIETFKTVKIKRP